jgi:hypothetical protein
MSQTDQALQTVIYWARAAFGLLLSVFAVIEQACHRLLSQAGVPAQMQTLIILALAVVFIVAVLRLFGGLFRLLLMVLLILLILHVVFPNSII